MHDRVKEVSAIVGNNIRKHRKKLKLTQLDLEVSTGIGRSEFSRIENGAKNLELSTLVKIADALKIPIADLFK